MNHQYDVIIVGAGMVGASLAVALSHEPSLSIALIEAYPIKPLSETDPIDLRVCALNQASEQLLDNLGIWQQLIDGRIGHFSDMRVWETLDSEIHFTSADIGEAYLGHIVENRHLQQACLQAVQQKQNIDFLCPEKPVSMTEHTLQLESGRIITADLIVGADGARSPLRDWAGIKSKGWDYQQSGIVCTVTTENPHNNTARQRFLTDGPLAFLPLADPNQCSIVWSNTQSRAEELTSLDDTAFQVELANAFQHQLGDITAISTRAAFPLTLRHAQQYVTEGFALVGDAAHTIHPLAGQGVNIGLLDAATLAEIILQAKQKGRRIDSLHTLNKYQRQRKGDNLTIQLTMDLFKRVFGHQQPPLRMARQCSFQLVNKSSLLKNLFMQQAAGHRFANPKLTR